MADDRPIDPPKYRTLEQEDMTLRRLMYPDNTQGWPQRFFEDVAGEVDFRMQYQLTPDELLDRPEPIVATISNDRYLTINNLLSSSRKA